MINWQEMEERVYVYGKEAAAVDVETSERAEFIEEFESERTLRRRLACALIGLGVRLDPGASAAAATNS